MKPELDAIAPLAPPATSKGLTVYLHVAIPTAKENARLVQSLPQRLRRTLRQAVDWCAWWWNQTFLFKSYNYARIAYSNRGDIAIKLAIKELLRKSLDGYAVTFVETEWGRLDDATLNRINDHAALFVIAGGGYWVFDHAKKISPSFLLDAPYLNQMQCGVVVFGSGVNFNMPNAHAALDGNVDAELKSTLLRFDRKVSLFAVRCKSTLDFFQDVGMHMPQLLCDPAVCKELGKLPQRADPDELAMGINFAFHGKFVEQLLQQNIATYIEFLKIIGTRFHPRFYYFIHSEEEFLVARLLQSSGIRLEVVDVPAAELAAAYTLVDVLVCQMMHANILSFNAGVPALNIAYDSKNVGFNELIGMQDFCLSAYTVNLDQLVEKMSTLIADRNALAIRLRNRKKELEIKMERTLGQIREIALTQVDQAPHEHRSQQVG